MCYATVVCFTANNDNNKTLGKKWYTDYEFNFHLFLLVEIHFWIQITGPW